MMRTQLIRMNTFFEKLPIVTVKYRYLFWLLFIGLTLLMGAGLPRFKIDMSWNSLLRPQEPVKVAYDRFRAVFGGDEVLYLAYEALDGDVFSKNSLTAVSELTHELERKWAGSPDGGENSLGRITDITSLINASYLEGGTDTLISRDFVGGAIPEKKGESDEFRKQALQHPDYPLILCSEDSRYGGIIIRTDFNARIAYDSKESDQAGRQAFAFEPVDGTAYLSSLDNELPHFKTSWMQDYAPFMTGIHEIIGKEKYTRHLKFHPAGSPELMGFLGSELEKEMGLIILGSLILILLVLSVLFRSFKAVVWPLVIIISTIVWTVGTMGWCGIAMSDFINIVVFLLIAVGVADSVHILSGYLLFRQSGKDHKTALLLVYKKSGFACFLTSFTTAIGLLALSFAPIIAVQRLSIMGACGVMYAFFITVFMLPLMLDILKPIPVNFRDNQIKKTYIQRFLVFFEKISIRKPVQCVVIFSLFGLILVLGISKIEIDSNVLTIIRESKPIRNNFDVVDRELAGTGSIEILVDTGIPDGLKDPLVLKSIGRFQQSLETNFTGIVRKTQSIVDVTRNAFKVLNEGRQEMYIIPDDRATLSQTLFLFATANPKDRRLLVSDDFRAARITVNTRNFGSQEGLAFMAQVNKEIKAYFSALKTSYPDMRIESTGQVPLFLRMMDLISQSQIQSFGICLLLVSVIMLLVIKDLPTGLIAIVPNLFPILAVFGIMGWFSFPLDVHTLLVVPIIIGISVDDTIHFITHFSLELQKGNSVEKAMNMTMKEAGQAIVFTSLVLAVGYLAFLICVNKGFAYFGFLSSVAVLTALLSDLVLLPAMLHLKGKAPRK